MTLQGLNDDVDPWTVMLLRPTCEKSWRAFHLLTCIQYRIDLVSFQTYDAIGDNALCMRFDFSN